MTAAARIVLAVSVALLAGCGRGGGGGGDGASGADDGTTTTTALLEDAGRREVALHVPDGWAVSDDGLRAAEDAADVGAAEPVGPVVVAEVVDLEAPFDPVAGQQAVVEEGVDALEYATPERTTVDGADAVSVVVRGGGRVRATIVVHDVDTDPVVFTIDCPADRFDELNALLTSVPGLD